MADSTLDDDIDPTGAGVAMNSKPTLERETKNLAGNLGLTSAWTSNHDGAVQKMGAALKGADPQQLKNFNDAMSDRSGILTSRSEAFAEALKGTPPAFQKKILGAVSEAAKDKTVGGDYILSGQLQKISEIKPEGETQAPATQGAPTQHDKVLQHQGPRTAPTSDAATSQKHAAPPKHDEKHDAQKASSAPTAAKTADADPRSAGNFGANSGENLWGNISKGLKNAKSPEGKNYSGTDLEKLQQFLRDNGYVGRGTRMVRQDNQKKDDADIAQEKALDRFNEEMKSGKMGPETRKATQLFLKEQTGYTGPVDGSPLDTQARAFMYAKVNSDPQLFEKPQSSAAQIILKMGNDVAGMATRQPSPSDRARLAGMRASQANAITVEPLQGQSHYSADALTFGPNEPPAHVKVTPNSKAAPLFAHSPDLAGIKGAQSQQVSAPEQQKPDTGNTVVAKNDRARGPRNDIYFGH